MATKLLPRPFDPPPQPERVKRPAEWLLMKSIKQSYCIDCKRHIIKGDDIFWRPRTGAKHVDCRDKNVRKRLASREAQGVFIPRRNLGGFTSEPPSIG